MDRAALAPDATREPGVTAVDPAAGTLARHARPVLALAAIALLAACQDASGLLGRTAGDEQAAADAPASVRLVEREVEAPEIFQVDEPGLWDGRPSLGGVWVAYPGDIEPQRVIIRNTENGKFVIGALFRRERVSPGPKIQVSSDAAAALEILAGRPTVLNVTALKRVSVPETQPEKDAKKAAKPSEKTPKKADAAARPEKKEAAPRPAQDRPAPRRGLAGLRDRAAAAIRKARGQDTGKEAARTPEPAAASAPEAAAKPAGRPASTLAKPFIQIGIFSVRQNAENTATSLRTRGVVPLIKQHRLKGKTYWRVIIGPASTAGERAALLKTARELGFADAYFVTN